MRFNVIISTFLCLVASLPVSLQAAESRPDAALHQEPVLKKYQKFEGTPATPEPVKSGHQHEHEQHITQPMEGHEHMQDHDHAVHQHQHGE
ncbi:hypothetical protein SAMN05192560_0879 [Methylobacillus rhizosphaerae]|uniref:Secreted protein n=2 Tax=Methylobacillus rhizosphaerae TaxID=551994 RepID=A0A238YWX3_9PROT|nr:hypothetical protein SAMN05192560_0879 [Methylobacillus rhizosphaerae]